MVKDESKLSLHEIMKRYFEAIHDETDFDACVYENDFQHDYNTDDDGDCYTE